METGRTISSFSFKTRIKSSTSDSSSLMLIKLERMVLGFLALRLGASWPSSLAKASERLIPRVVVDAVETRVPCRLRLLD